MKVKLKAALAALVAAVTSPTAVKAEKSVAVLVVTRVLLAVGSSAAVVELVVKVVNGL